jgi:hypothetical protein
MGAEFVVDAVVVGLFALALIGILAYTIATSRPDPAREPHGGDAIVDAIQTYDRRTRVGGWFPTVFAVPRRRTSIRRSKRE